MPQPIDAILITRHDNGVAVAALSYRQGNAVSTELLEALQLALTSLGDDPSVRAVVLTSAQGSFSGGFDPLTLYNCTNEDELAALSQQLKDTVSALEHFSRPVVAALEGECLGAGLDLALGADVRIAADDPHTRVGFPEVEQGVIPAGGGTQRLVRLVGLDRALSLLVTGRVLNARQAVDAGLLDEAVSRWVLLDVAMDRALRLTQQEPERDWRKLLANARRRAPAATALGRRLTFKRAADELRGRPASHWPAPHAILAVTRRGLEHGIEAGMRAESEHFARLAVSPSGRSRMEVALWRQALGASPRLPHGEAHLEEAATPVHKVAILGAGRMGSAIAAATLSHARCRVRLQDRDGDALGEGVRDIYAHLARELQRGRSTPVQTRRAKARLTTTLDYRGLRSCELVLEAVAEDLEVKHAVLRELEGHLSPTTVLATNTSSLSLRELAVVLEHPERLVGMHYFAPATHTPLCEVALGEHTSHESLATAVRFAHAQGKSVVLVNDGPGFYTTRILMPYLNEAVQLVVEGTSPAAVDRGLEAWGFPVGPLALIDSLGLSAVFAIARNLAERLGDRMAPAAELEALIEHGHQGKSAGQGFYLYDGEHKVNHPGLRGALAARRPRGRASRRDITQRCVSVLFNEAARCLAQGVLLSVRDGDAAAVLGLGYPAFRGGPFHTMDRQSLRLVVQQMENLQRRHGARFAPAPIIESLAAAHGTFHEYVGPGAWQTREPDRATVVFSPRAQPEAMHESAQPHP